MQQLEPEVVPYRDDLLAHAIVLNDWTFMVAELQNRLACYGKRQALLTAYAKKYKYVFFHNADE